MFERDENGILHVVALSGGHDSSALALELQQREPRPYTYVCTPTGDEAPAMFAHWLDLGNRLGSKVVPVMAGTLDGLIEKQNAIPNFKARWCTRILKIEPFIKWLHDQLKDGPVVAYVGLRADEPTRVGGVYGQVGEIEIRCPLREWGYGEDEVQASLRKFGVVCPDRTDCLKCYHQRIGEWWECWKYHPEVLDDAISQERATGNTFRTPKLDEYGNPVMVTRMGLTYAACWRDSWPVRLEDMRTLFEMGHSPAVSLARMERERMNAGGCRVCAM